MDEVITFFGETDARNSRVRFGIKAKDRTKHVYVIGKTGMGKSTLLENMAIQDIQSGNGMAFLDPHGKTAELLLRYIPEHRIKDVIYFAPFDTEHPISFNVLEDIGPDKRHLIASGLMSIFKRIWADAWSARMEYILNNTLLALLEYPGATLLGVNRMLSDKDYRKTVVDNVKDPSIKAFWVDEFAKYNERYMQEAGDAIKNKIGQFTSNPVIRNIVGQPHSSFDMRKVMDEKKILIVNLSKGRIGEANANLIGGMIVTKIYLAAMSRADVKESRLKTLPNFYLFVDEFQSFTNDSFADILSEARKYNLNLTIAHQYIEQMSEIVRAAVFGNVGTMITFRVGAPDAEFLEKEFSPAFLAEDLVNLGIFQIYLKLMIDGVSSKPFSAKTMAPIPEGPVNHRDAILETSRQQFSMPREGVDNVIKEWHDKSFAAEKRERSPRPEGEAPRSPMGQAPRDDRRPMERPSSFAPSRPADNNRPPRTPASNSYNSHSNSPSRPMTRTAAAFVPIVVPTPEKDDSDGFASLGEVKKEVLAKPEPAKIIESKPEPLIKSEPIKIVTPIVENNKIEIPKVTTSEPVIVPVKTPVMEMRPQSIPARTDRSQNIGNGPVVTKPNFGGKKATESNLNDLRSLLASVTKKNEEKKEEIKKEVKAEIKTEEIKKAEEVKPVPPTESSKAQVSEPVLSKNDNKQEGEIKEIPAETLKKILEIKE